MCVCVCVFFVFVFVFFFWPCCIYITSPLPRGQNTYYASTMTKGVITNAWQRPFTKAKWKRSTRGKVLYTPNVEPAW